MVGRGVVRHWAEWEATRATTAGTSSGRVVLVGAVSAFMSVSSWRARSGDGVIPLFLTRILPLIVVAVVVGLWFNLQLVSNVGPCDGILGRRGDRVTKAAPRTPPTWHKLVVAISKRKSSPGVLERSGILASVPYLF